MSENNPVYSIQQTYIIKPVSKSEKRLLTCDERIDIPTIEPLPSVKPVYYTGQPLTVIPCIELAGELLSEFNLTFETNEGVTVLPIKIAPGQDDTVQNPYTHFRYVLALPSGATGVKSCKLIHKATGKEVQHNFTFGIMPPPYNYDNALFGYISYNLEYIRNELLSLKHLTLTTRNLIIDDIRLQKNAGKQTIAINNRALFYETQFSYPLSSEPTIHKPKITLHYDSGDRVYTLSLNKTTSTVTIDLLTGTMTVYDWATGEIIQQSKLWVATTLETLSFENFDDIEDPFLLVLERGVYVE